MVEKEVSEVKEWEGVAGHATVISQTPISKGWRLKVEGEIVEIQWSKEGEGWGVSCVSAVHENRSKWNGKIAREKELK